MAELVSWEGYFGARSLLEHALQNASSLGDRTPPAPGVSLAAKAVARVSGGRWIADCPCEGCADAELVSFDSPFFFCCECRNAAFDNMPIQVAVPGAGARTDIEAYLVARPVPATRNWLPDETVADLRDENRARGILLPEDEEA
jgi:hypothetical protein